MNSIDYFPHTIRSQAVDGYVGFDVVGEYSTKRRIFSRKAAIVSLDSRIACYKRYQRKDTLIKRKIIK